MTDEPFFAPVRRWRELTGMGPTATYTALQRGHLRAKKVGRATLIEARR